MVHSVRGSKRVYQVKLCDPSTMRVILERFCDGVSS